MICKYLDIRDTKISGPFGKDKFIRRLVCKLKESDNSFKLKIAAEETGMPIIECHVADSKNWNSCEKFEDCL